MSSSGLSFHFLTHKIIFLTHKAPSINCSRRQFQNLSSAAVMIGALRVNKVLSFEYLVRKYSTTKLACIIRPIVPGPRFMLAGELLTNCFNTHKFNVMFWKSMG